MKKKTIAILTQPLGKNYGGILQNFALQKVLLKLNHKPVTINRLLNNNVSPLKLVIYYFKIERIIFRKTYNFLKKHISLSKKIDSNKKIISHFEKFKYDAIIVGSDQTWRPRISPNINNYFLDFLQNQNSKKTKKIAYASSFGTSEWEFSESQTETAKTLIKQFDAISVREDSGVELCEKYLNIKATHVLDPTLLLDKEDYEILYKNKGFIKNEGIFVYVLDQKDENDFLINNVANLLDKKIFRNQSKASISRNENSKRYPALETWVKSFDDADFIITDSFHGTVFSILYQKPFITIVNSARGASRFSSLLRPLELDYRMIEDTTKMVDSLLTENIDYKNVNKKLEKMKQKSLSFLKNSLS